MTAFSDALRDLVAKIGPLAVPGVHEAAEQLSRADRRAVWLKQRRPLTDAVARRVALFSLSAWAQRWPVRSFDLGEDAALFVADWLTARNVDSLDAMHEALEAWRDGEFVGRLRLAIAGCA